MLSERIHEDRIRLHIARIKLVVLSCKRRPVPSLQFRHHLFGEVAAVIVGTVVGDGVPPPSLKSAA